MDEKNREKVVSGIATQRIIGKREREILLVRKNDTWIFPGGKPENGESELECLSREISEKLPRTRFKIKEHYCTAKGMNPHKNNRITVEGYFIHVSKVGKPSREIKQVRWFNRGEIKDRKYDISSVTSRIIESLIEHNYF